MLNVPAMFEVIQAVVTVCFETQDGIRDGHTRTMSLSVKHFRVNLSSELYVRRVYLMDDSDILIPWWLNFGQGVVGSEVFFL